MIYAVIVLSVLVILLGVLFFFLEKRQQSLLKAFSETLERIELIEDNCRTLRQNDDILANDLKMLLHEFKGVEKKVVKPVAK